MKWNPRWAVYMRWRLSLRNGPELRIMGVRWWSCTRSMFKRLPEHQAELRVREVKSRDARQLASLMEKS